MSEHARFGSRAAPPASPIDDAILALRATRGDANEAAKTLERIGLTLEHPSAVQRAGVIARLSLRHYNGQVAAVAGIGLLLATTSYAALGGLPSPLSSWFSLGTRTPAAEVGSARSRTARPRLPMTPVATTPARPQPVAPAVVPEVAPVSPLPGGPAGYGTPGDSGADGQHVRTRSRGPAAQRPAVAAEAGGAAREQSSSSEAAPLDDASLKEERDRLYTEAHRLHFVIRDYSAALHAWERYLRLAGDAPLAVEARYNRALCLVRIGDHSAARAALTAIARGEEGAYRQREARALLRVLR